MANAEPFVESMLKRNKVVVFSKSYSPEGRICETLLKYYEQYLPEDIYEWINIEKRSDCPQVENYLWLLSGKNNREVPLIFVKQRFLGGYNEITRMHNDGRLAKLLKNVSSTDDKDDESEDDESKADLEADKMTVRVERLDDTEVSITVAGAFDKVNTLVDFDPVLYELKGYLSTGTESDVQGLFQEAEDEKEMLGVCAARKITADSSASTLAMFRAKEWDWMPLKGPTSLSHLSVTGDTDTLFPETIIQRLSLKKTVAEKSSFASMLEENVSEDDSASEETTRKKNRQSKLLTRVRARQSKEEMRPHEKDLVVTSDNDSELAGI